jgi:hypothetical protein
VVLVTPPFQDVKVKVRGCILILDFMDIVVHGVMDNDMSLIDWNYNLFTGE